MFYNMLRNCEDHWKQRRNISCFTKKKKKKKQKKLEKGSA